MSKGGGNVSNENVNSGVGWLKLEWGEEWGYSRWFGKEGSGGGLGCSEGGGGVIQYEFKIYWPIYIRIITAFQPIKKLYLEWS